mgnify:CR=1 FL=1
MSTLLSDVALVLLCLGALVVLWGLLSPVKRLPTWSHKHDKLLHAMAFAVLAVLAYASWPGIHLVGLWLALSLAGLASEGLQQLTPERRFCWRDAAAGGYPVFPTSGGAQNCPRLPVDVAAVAGTGEHGAAHLQRPHRLPQEAQR